MRRERGFTLTELLISIAVAGILAAVAIPGFIGLIKSENTSAQANNLVFMLNFARSEAVKQDARVMVCPSSDGQTCTNANTWQIGWMAFCYSGAPAATHTCTPYSGTPPVVPLRSSPALPTGYTLTSLALAGATPPNVLTFLPSGGVLTPASFVLCDGQQQLQYALDIEVLITGRTEASRYVGVSTGGTTIGGTALTSC
jgi:prepilin-type N-terminal cleavage/methylation domain-containing protein